MEKTQNGRQFPISVAFRFHNPANETFLDVKEDSCSLIVAVMLTKKRLPERFEIFCCCICLFTAYFSGRFCATSLCEYNFMCWKIYIGMARRNLYLLYIILPSRKSSEGLEKISAFCDFSISLFCRLPFGLLGLL
jgi:hypothetical protein